MQQECRARAGLNQRGRNLPCCAVGHWSAPTPFNLSTDCIFRELQSHQSRVLWNSYWGPNQRAACNQHICQTLKWLHHTIRMPPKQFRPRIAPHGPVYGSSHFQTRRQTRRHQFIEAPRTPSQAHGGAQYLQWKILRTIRLAALASRPACLHSGKELLVLFRRR